MLAVMLSGAKHLSSHREMLRSTQHDRPTRSFQTGWHIAAARALGAINCALTSPHSLLRIWGLKHDIIKKTTAIYLYPAFGEEHITHDPSLYHSPRPGYQ